MSVTPMQKLSAALSLTALIIAGCASQAQTPAAAPMAGKTEVLWLGQASFRIKSPGGKIIVVDPWLSGGPKTPAPYKTDLSALGKVDVLLVTHAHVDHIGDSAAIAKLNNTVLYGPADIGAYEYGTITALDTAAPSVPGKPTVVLVSGVGAVPAAWDLARAVASSKVS